MKEAFPLVILGLLVLGLFVLTRRNRQRAAAEDERRRESISFGTEVMTTSGLYGTVTRVDDDDTVQLAIAPGIEVRWALAALRDVQSLPGRYQQAQAAGSEDVPEERTER